MNSSDSALTSDDDWLESALRDAGREYRADYLPEDGFTASVMTRLPQRSESPAWRRPVVLVMWSLVGAAALISLPGLFDQVFRNAVALLVGHRVGWIDVATVLALLSTGTWGGLLYAARID